uniref:Secreted protein n=1 Tax=Mesocestoides corti TaxID=53468 RepID=A0A5K3FSJ5_MESCO
MITLIKVIQAVNRKVLLTLQLLVMLVTFPKQLRPTYHLGVLTKRVLKKVYRYSVQKLRIILVDSSSLWNLLSQKMTGLS